MTRLSNGVAHHEAGHAVAAVALGQPFLDAQVFARPTFNESNGKKCLGRLRHDSETDFSGCAWNLAVCDLAGPVAEARYSKRSLTVVTLCGGMDDYNSALAYLDGNDARMTAVFAHTGALLRQHWPAVRAVAKALVEHGRVGRGAVAMIARNAREGVEA